MDRLSGWPCIVPCGPNTMASRITRMFCYYFQEVGVSLCLRTDGGPKFTSSKFRVFLQCWVIYHVILSPH